MKFFESFGEGGFVKVCKGVLIKFDLDEEDVEIVIKWFKSDVL